MRFFLDLEPDLCEIKYSVFDFFLYFLAKDERTKTTCLSKNDSLFARSFGFISVLTFI